MAETSSIEWTDATWQPITGCAIVSPGCTNCYAMKLAGTRLRNLPSRKGLTIQTKAGPVWNGKVRLNEEWLTQPLTWRRPRKIFVCAHGDLFAEGVPDEWIDRVFAVMALCPQHTFQVLTKRADRMRAYLSDLDTTPRIRGWMESHEKHCGPIAHFPHLGPGGGWPLPNVWLGVSAEDQRRADARIPDLLASPAAIRWVSAEPLLGAIDFLSIAWPGLSGHRVDVLRKGYWTRADAGSPFGRSAEAGEPKGFFTNHSDMPARLDWIVVGGESGPGARPMHPDWARKIRDDCAAAGVAYLFKQWGAYVPAEIAARRGQLSVITTTGTHLRGSAVLDQPNDGAAEIIALVGKKAAGRLLDGVEHNGIPEVRL